MEQDIARGHVPVDDPCQMAVSDAIGDLLNECEDLVFSELLSVGLELIEVVEEVSSVGEVHDDVKNEVFQEKAFNVDDVVGFEFEEFFGLLIS